MPATNPLFDFPRGSELARVISPSYRTQPPCVHRAELIPTEARQKMSAAWDRRFVPETPVSLHRVADCTVVGEGLVFDAAGAVLRASLTQHLAKEVAGAHEIMAAAQHQGPIPSLDAAILCCKRGAANYGHWLIEMLPMAYMGLRWDIPSHARFLVPGLPLSSAVRDGMALLGVAPERLYPCGAPVHVRELFVVTGLSSHGIALSPLVLEALDAVGAAVRPGPFEKVWVSREGWDRRLRLETELCQALHARGWAIAAPSLFSFSQQIALFKGAHRVAGVCGAGLANTVFTPPGAAVTSFAPATMPDTLYWLLSELGDRRFREIRCPLAPGRTGTEPWDGLLELTLPEALRELG